MTIDVIGTPTKHRNYSRNKYHFYDVLSTSVRRRKIDVDLTMDVPETSREVDALIVTFLFIGIMYTFSYLLT